MGDRDAHKPRDPAAEKQRDLGRQRKIASNGSDKAARRHARTIKAMANRHIRRKDKQTLDAEFDESADQINLDHAHKPRHWGTDNAAERRAQNSDRQDYYQQIGGRDEAQRLQLEAARDRTDNVQAVKYIDDLLEQLAAKKKDKG